MSSAHREWIVQKASVPAHREEILLTASVPVKMETIIHNHVPSSPWWHHCGNEMVEHALHLLISIPREEIVWDPTLHRWVNKTEPKAENKCVPPPPPMGTYGYQGNTGSVPKGVNPYSMKAAGLWGSRYPTMHYNDGTNSKPPSHGPGLLPRQLSGLLPPSHFDLMAPMVVPPDTLPY
ncbi:protein transport protein Sec16A-like [Salvelinus namaycush]|uniref:Protein transport protein Sec16A-like n=1 Tax=Salvelinus namaycush TaxID=8040 RepID=A0A8U1GZH9_SALNM|nr:protein transport protein Sec16A-like [Salvelinus namaycush]